MSDLVAPLLEAAVLAPSSHNTQPWIFERVSPTRVRLLADRRRALPVNDPHDRELTISCGCALTNLRVAAAARGLAVSVETGPFEADPDRLAEVELGAGRAEPELAPLAEAISTRRTCRDPFAEGTVSGGTLAGLAEAAEAEGAWLRPVEGEGEREAVAALVAEGDRLQWDDPRWRRELAAWLHPRREGDGLTVPGLVAPVARLIVRGFDMGGRVGAKDAGLAAESPALAMLGTAGDAPEDWLAAGQALQRVLLTAAAEGVQASYLNQPIQVEALRPRLAEALGLKGAPQILLRLGVPEETPEASPRRPLGAVTSEAG